MDRSLWERNVTRSLSIQKFVFLDFLLATQVVIAQDTSSGKKFSIRVQRKEKDLALEFTVQSKFYELGIAFKPLIYRCGYVNPKFDFIASEYLASKTMFDVLMHGKLHMKDIQMLAQRLVDVITFMDTNNVFFGKLSLANIHMKPKNEESFVVDDFSHGMLDVSDPQLEYLFLLHDLQECVQKFPSAHSFGMLYDAIIEHYLKRFPPPPIGYSWMMLYKARRFHL